MERDWQGSSFQRAESLSSHSWDKGSAFLMTAQQDSIIAMDQWLLGISHILFSWVCMVVILSLLHHCILCWCKEYEEEILSYLVYGPKNQDWIWWRKLYTTQRSWMFSCTQWLDGAFGYLHLRESKFVLCVGRWDHMDIWSEKLTVPSLRQDFLVPGPLHLLFPLTWMTIPRSLNIYLLMPFIWRLPHSCSQISAYILSIQWNLSFLPKLSGPHSRYFPTH